MITKIIRNNNIKCLLAGQAVSSLGDYMATVILTAFVYQNTGSALSVAMIYLVSILPGVLGISIGPLLRYYPLRRIMIIVEFLQALIMVLIPMAAGFYLGAIYILVFVSSLLSVVFHSSRMALLADASGGAPIDKVNSIDQTLQLISPILGMALGGAVLSLPFNWVFLINSITFLCSSFFVWRVTVGNVPESHVILLRGSFFKDFKAGFSYINNNSVLMFNIYGNFLINLGAGAYNSMLIVYAFSQLHKSTTGYTALLIAEYAGLSITGLAFSFIIKEYSKGKWLVFGNILMGVLIVAFATTHSTIIACTIAFLVGSLNLITNTISRTMLMESAESGMRSVVMNFRFALGRPINTLGAIFAGLLTEYSGGVSGAVVFAGSAILLSGILALFTSSVVNYDEIRERGSESNLG